MSYMDYLQAKHPRKHADELFKITEAGYAHAQRLKEPYQTGVAQLFVAMTLSTDADARKAYRAGMQELERMAALAGGGQ